MVYWDGLWEQARNAFTQTRTWKQGKALGLGSLIHLGRATVTGLLTTLGQEQEDWTKSYRLFSASRFQSERLFQVVLEDLIRTLSPEQPLVVALDDTLIRKTGKTIYGGKWLRDSQGPPFQTNLVWGQRFVQVSLGLPHVPGAWRGRMIPFSFQHYPWPVKPGKKASEAEWKIYRAFRKSARLGLCAIREMKKLRQQVDGLGMFSRALLVAVDGGYTNSTVFRALPERTMMIGRLRKDAKLYALPTVSSSASTGRPRIYGERLPTPEEFRQDPQIPYQSIKVWAAQKEQSFKIKTISPVLSRMVGSSQPLRLVIIAPLGYRLSSQSRILYRQPAYLLCTDPSLSLEQILQAYLWRWEIEVNFRDEKTLLGVGQAQVRSHPAVEKVPQLMVASYAFMLLAYHHIYGTNRVQIPPPPKWRPIKRPQRTSTLQMIAHCRNLVWQPVLHPSSFSGFVNPTDLHFKPQKLFSSLPSAVIYASG
jgi:hypothetical protein